MKRIICILIGHKWHVDHIFDGTYEILLCDRCHEVKGRVR